MALSLIVKSLDFFFCECAVSGQTAQMCNRVTNTSDTGIFSKRGTKQTHQTVVGLIKIENTHIVPDYCFLSPLFSSFVSLSYIAHSVLSLPSRANSLSFLQHIITFCATHCNLSLIFHFPYTCNVE